MAQFRTNLTYTYTCSRLGDLLLAGTRDRLHLPSFPAGPKAFTPLFGWDRDERAFIAAREQLRA